jgi:hypothetical protein
VNGTYAGAFGYSDDDFFLAPTATALQGMIKIAETFCNGHGLQFLTDPNPVKYKTKCISWLKKQRELSKMKLNGNFLPWVEKVLHLGNTITYQKDCMKTDMSIKTAKYVSKNIEINQELSFAASKTRLKINSIYNLSWYGSTLWNLFGSNAIKVESSYNRSIKCSLNFPYATHRYLIKPISGRRHVKWLLISRFLKYMEKIEKSKKPILKVLK